MPDALKERYRTRLGLIIAANVVVLVAFLTLPVVDFAGLRLVATQADDLSKGFGSAAVCTVAVSILNGLVPSHWKARLVFWRWRHPLPGSRAASLLAADPRIDMVAVERQFGALPADPSGQNAAWYRIYRTVQDEPAVSTTHEDFLFARDYAALSALFLVIFGAGAFYVMPASDSRWTYWALLALQYLIVSFAARNYGTRLVTTSVAVAQKGA